MIVTCPNCQTRYNLPDDKVPAGGAKVKCSKCSNVFKAEHPPASPEEEVESLLEDETSSTDTQAGDEFEETFDDVASGGEEKAADESPAAEESAPAADDEEDMSDMDDLFDESGDAGADDAGDADDADATDSESVFSEDDGDDLFAEMGDDDTDEDGDSLFEDDDEDEDDDGDDDDDDLFEDEDDDDDDDDDEYEDDDDMDLDDDTTGGSSRRSLGCLIILLVLAVLIAAGVYFKAWTYLGIDLGSMVKNVPFVSSYFMEETGGDNEAAPGESPADRVRKIELKNVKQYYVANEKVGNLFVVEGKAVNKFAEPKEQIKVEVVLYDTAGNVLASQPLLCGNVLSQFQLQVQTEKEIRDGLESQVGILSNNTFIRPGASTPFMAVFFQPPTGVKEFLVKVVDVGDPE